ncbi:MAG TPA: DUF167 domain-containing protein [Candidatus Manganitrophaceae bacterium]|nr:DUF167 domain-containing protein [Candidatus Manganitrophaceae bacterium]
MKLSVKVIPKSSRNGVVGWMGEVLKVCVTAPPERGKANEAVEALLAEALGLPRGQLRVAAGLSSPRKVIEIEGLEPAEVRRRLSSENI